MALYSVAFKQACISVAALVVSVVVALAAAPVALGAVSFELTPAPQTTVTQRDVVVEAQLIGTTALRQQVTMTLDGTSVTPTVTLSPDRRTLRATYLAHDLPDGAHDVTVAVPDASKTVHSTSWSFNVAMPAVVSWTTPVDGAQPVTLDPIVSAEINGNGSVIAWVSMTVNGEQVVPDWAPAVKIPEWVADPCRGTITWDPPARLLDDQIYNIVVTAETPAGILSHSWSFVPHSQPMMGRACTRCHPAYPGSHSMAYACGACHDGVQAPVLTDTKGSVRKGHGTSPLSRKTCADCHPGYDLSEATQNRVPDHGTAMTDFSKCTTCHERQLTRDHSRRSDASGTPLTCDTCHGSGADPAVSAAVANHSTACLACHAAAESGDPHNAAHVAPDLDAGCIGQGCHVSANVVLEHEPRFAEFGATDACALCHLESGPDRMGGTRNRSCSGCHSPCPVL